MKRTVQKLCRKCHDALERIIMNWERTVSKLWEQHPEFYTWVVDAFLDTTTKHALEPPNDMPFHRQRAPWIAYEPRTAL